MSVERGLALGSGMCTNLTIYLEFDPSTKQIVAFSERTIQGIARHDATIRERTYLRYESHSERFIPMCVVKELVHMTSVMPDPKLKGLRTEVLQLQKKNIELERALNESLEYIKHLKNKISVLQLPTVPVKKRPAIIRGERIGHWSLEKGTVSYWSNLYFDKKRPGQTKKGKDRIVDTFTFPPFFSPATSKILLVEPDRKNIHYNICWERTYFEDGECKTFGSTNHFIIPIELLDIISEIDDDQWYTHFMNELAEVDEDGDFSSYYEISIPDNFKKWHTPPSEQTHHEKPKSKPTDRKKKIVKINKKGSEWAQGKLIQIPIDENSGVDKICDIYYKNKERSAVNIQMKSIAKYFLKHRDSRITTGDTVKNCNGSEKTIIAHLKRMTNNGIIYKHAKGDYEMPRDIKEFSSKYEVS